jgi:FkbM family methyltransferase
MTARTFETLAERVIRRVGWAIRDAWPDRPVQRTVQGVPMWLPWSHRLPDYARLAPQYGQNLVQIAAELGRSEQPLHVVDVGANVGDSTLQILGATAARVLCVEADGYFLDYLDRNVGDDIRVEIEPSLLTPDDDATGPMAPVRVGGTTRFEPGVSAQTAASVSTEQLRKRHRAFNRVRLIKSDTDGHDVALVPALAKAWADCTPVLFFEYDHVLSRKACNDPLAVWDQLASLGYTHAAAWTYSGRALGRFDVCEAAGLATALDGTNHEYWDVAVVHGTDQAGRAALERVMPTLIGAE